MANNPQFPGGGQFRPLVPAQQGQPFIPVPSQQFRPVGQGMPSSHVGMPAAQSQPLQFFQPIQQLPPWTNQPGPGAPSAQALSMPYVQPNRPLTSSQTQQTAPPLSNHMHGVGTSGIPISAPYALLYEEIVERAKEKEGKEAKKQQRLTNDFTKLLYTFKEVIASSNWEDCKQLFEESREYRSIGEKSLIKEIFEEYVTHLQERAKEKEHKHEEEKARKEKDREEKRQEKR